MPQPPNNPAKLPLMYFGLVVWVALLVVGVTQGLWLVVVAAALFLPWGWFGIRATRQGRNPWYNRAPADWFMARKRDT